jgi:hypothetical protein
MMKIANAIAPNTRISTALRNNLIEALTPLICPMVALFVPSISSSLRFSLSPPPKRVFQLIPRISLYIDISERIAGIQHAAARSVAIPKLGLSGTGII